MEKGSKEILESKEQEIKKLSDIVFDLRNQVENLTREKDALEKERNDLMMKSSDNPDQTKKILDLTEQIKVYKMEISDKQKEFAHEKAELQKVIEEQKSQIQKGSVMPPDFEKLNKELSKAQTEVKEAAVERERFQSQLEMLVQELEQKQVHFFFFI